MARSSSPRDTPSVTTLQLSGSAYSCQLQACNMALCVLGAIAVGLAGSQFARPAGLPNIQQIDLRMLSFFHILVGLIGFYCVGRNHGSIVIKSLYIVSVVYALGSTVFYAVTTYKVVKSYHELLRLEHIGGFTGIFGMSLPTNSREYVNKIVITAIMTGVSAFTTLAGLISVILLERLVIVERPWYPAQRDLQFRVKFCRTQLTAIALVKLFIGLITLGLATFVEYQHESITGGREDYILIALDHIAAMLTIASVSTDLYAVFNKLHSSLNLKVSIALSTVAAIWCLKSVDNNMYPFYKSDITNYRITLSINQLTLATINHPQYVIVIVHGVLIGLFSILFLLCAFSSLIAASCLRENLAKVHDQLNKELIYLNRFDNCSKIFWMIRFLALLHVFWASCLMVLIILGLIDLPWNGDYVGGDLLWVAVLAIATGVLGSFNEHIGILVKSTLVFTLNMLTLAICIEKVCVTLNLIYQSATHPDYTNENVFDRKNYVGQIILHCVQCFVLSGEMLTAFWGTLLFGRKIRRHHNTSDRNYSSALHFCCSFGALFYGIIFSGCYVLFEIGKWRFSEVPFDVPFYRLANGPLALAVFIVQILGCFDAQFLLTATLLQIALSSLALFVINSAITNVYYLHVLITTREMTGGLSKGERSVLVVALVLSITAVFACILQTICGVISILRSSYLFHHQSSNESITRNSSSLQFEHSYYGGYQNGIDSAPNPAIHQITIQPIEEQTLYWSADEHPYIYKSTKRVYGQPYPVESPNYESGYGSPTRYFYNSAFTTNNNNDDGAGPSSRRIDDSITQTRIAHAVSAKS